MIPELPIDAWLDRIEDELRRSRAVVLVAEPGAGKSTRIPPRLAGQGRTILLQPRRVAARSVARRIADERQWQIGREVGWHVRFDRRESRETRLLVATEGILTARLQSDPLASAYQTIILDEFHERSIHSDLAIALAREAWLARDDLRLVVMSATLDPAPVQRYLEGAAVIHVPGRTFPVDVSWAPDSSVPEALLSAHNVGRGHTLAFLPGAAEIERAREEIVRRSIVPEGNVYRLHGSMEGREQDEAIRPSQHRKVILATNVAETSITIDGVDLVIDGGQHKVMRYDAESGIDRLVLERIPLDAAAQRSGRAGRTGPGRAVRLWDPRSILEPRREPEIHRIDLASAVLDLYGWGADPREFGWFERPDPQRLELAIALLAQLGFVRDGRITEAGRSACRVPAHPRVARFLEAAGGGARPARMAAAIGEGVRLSPGLPASDSDLLALFDEAGRSPAVRAAARELAAGGETGGAEDDDVLLRAVLAAWPDRVARRRPGSMDRYQLASGGGAVLSRETTVRSAEWIVAVQLGSVVVEGVPTALIRLASRIEPEWLPATETRTVTETTSSGPVAWKETLYGELVLVRQRAQADESTRRAWRVSEIENSTDPALQQLKRRIAFAGIDLELAAVAAETGTTSAARIIGALPYKVRKQLDASAPTMLRVPSGRERPLSYTDDGGVELEVKLQELFGMIETPRIGPRSVPLTIVMLAPNGRPVQTTRDLRSFWDRTYFEVRKELRGRYPKHPWPENPLEAEPTHRTRRR